MHEFSVARSICRIALEEARRNGVTRITSVCVEVGTMRQVVPQLLRTAFDVASRNTALQGAELEIRKIPITIKCRSCGGYSASEQLQMRCDICQATEIEISGGNELLVSSIRVAEEVCHEH